MNAASASAACTAAGLVVLRAEVVGRQICVSVEPFDVQPETVIKRLAAQGLAFSLSFGSGVQVWMAAGVRRGDGMAFDDRNAQFQWMCKQPGCGKPRYEPTHYALCEFHYWEYVRQKQKRYRLRKAITAAR